MGDQGGCQLLIANILTHSDGGGTVHSTVDEILGRMAFGH